MDDKDRIIAELKIENAELKAHIAVLEKNSSNSSKPPSSDIVKPPKPRKDKERRRKIGAQPGHKQHLRKPLAPELVDEVVKLELTDCPDCGHQLDLAKIEPKTTQQIELVEKPYTVTEYQQLMYWCEQCQCHHYVALPEEVEKAGLFGKNMTALTGYLKGRGHMSYRTLKDYFHDVLGIEVSTGYGKRLLKYVKAMFATIHQQDTLSEDEFKRLMQEHKSAILKTVRRFVPEHKKAAVLVERFEKYGESYFLFIDKPVVDATNNVAERAIRTLVMDRLVTQGVRSDVGNEWHERFWTILATCKRQGLNVMTFLRESIFCLLHGLAPPSLLPLGK